MPEPITFAVIATEAGKAAIGALASLPVASAAGKLTKKTRETLTKGPLSRPLEEALRRASRAFLETFDVYAEDEATRARLKVMVKDERWAKSVAKLPLLNSRSIDTSECQELFSKMGPSNAPDGWFEVGWSRLIQEFKNAVASSESKALQAFVEISATEQAGRQRDRQIELHERQTELLEQLVSENSGPISDEVVEDYLESLCERYRYTSTGGLFFRANTGAGEAVELADIFVETELLEPSHPLPKTRKDQDDPSQDEVADALEAWQDASYSLEEPSAESGRRQTIFDVLSRERRLVILGPPGSGKSTLLKALTLALAQPETSQRLFAEGADIEGLPLLFELKVFASALAKDSNLRLDSFLLERWAQDLPNIRELLNSSKTVVFLDGLDEVLDEDHRRWVSSEVWRLMSRFRHARFVLTSRPLGYQAAPLPAPVSLWWMAPFTNKQIGRFFNGWYRTLEREGIERDPVLSAEERAEKLTESVLERDRIRAMARNPLLCTLIVMMYRSQTGYLPQRRVLFYQGAVETLVQYWERGKRNPKQTAPYELPEAELLIRALAEIAWRAFEELESREIPEDKLRLWLEESFADSPEWSGDRGMRAVADLLGLIQERTGILVPAGGGVYQFAHLSLHEYLVSYYIHTRLTEDETKSFLWQYLHSPQWNESLALLLGSAPEAQATRLARAILDNPTSTLEGQIHRDLRFVTRCLGDRAAAQPELRQVTASKLRAAVANANSIALPPLLEDAGYAAIKLDTDLILTEFDAYSRNFRLRWMFLKYLSSVYDSDERIRNMLFERLDEDNHSVRSTATLYLARLGSSDETIRDMFLERLGDDDPVVRATAVDYFTRLDSSDEAIRKAMFESLRDGDPAVRAGVVAYFARLGASHETIRTAIFQRLSDDKPAVRANAVFYFAHLRLFDETVRDAILERLDDDEPMVRLNAITYFFYQDSSDAVFRDALFKLLGAEDAMLRDEAVFCLLRLGSSDETVRDAMLERLDDDEPLVRASAVGFFANLGSPDETVRDAIFQRLGDDDRTVRARAVDYFESLDWSDEAIRDAILQRLTDDDPAVRARAVFYFVNLGAIDESIRDNMEEYVDSEDPLLRLLARLSAKPFCPERNLLEQILADYKSCIHSTPNRLDRELAKRIGRSMAMDKERQNMVFDAFSTQPETFDLGFAIESALEVEDRQRWEGA